MKQFFLLFLYSVLVRAQGVSVIATVDSQSVAIGSWIRYAVEVKHPANVAVSFPALKDTMGTFDIVRHDSLYRTEENGEVTLKKDFIIAKYDAGFFNVPPFAVAYRTPDGAIDTARSNPIPVEIRGVEVDTSQTIKDLKPQLTVPMSAEEVAAYVGILVALAGIGYGIYYYIQKRKRAVGLAPEHKGPELPPHVTALMQLEALEAKRLWQSGETKAYYTEATEIVRRYFERRFDIMALEMTTGEVMAQLERCSLEKGTMTTIEAVLSDADMVKFAKHQPIAAENEQLLSRARAVIERTKPSESTPAVNTANPSPVPGK